MAENRQQNTLHLYNTLTRKKEEFKSLEPGHVKMYACGPTVYNAPTIANLRTYISIDVLYRWLKYLGFKVEFVENITDIEDKIIKAVKEQGLDPEDKVAIKEYTQKYEDIFYDSLNALNIKKADICPHATDPEVIEQMINIIRELLANEFAYKTEDGIYFAISRYPAYGKLSRMDFSGIQEGVRIAADEYDKNNARDFALWKFAREGEPSWDAEFGAGRPGWHIECSAMAQKYLGDSIDIHAGGEDLVFPHHENEIAQSEAVTGKDFARFWFHAGHMMIEGQRMGKSLNNFYVISDLGSKFEVEPLALRLLSLQSHYRERLNFTHSNIKDAQNTLNNLREFVAKLDQWPAKYESRGRFENQIEIARKSFKEAMDDDLSTPKALAVVFDLIKKANKEHDLSTEEAKAIYQYILDVDRVLGLKLNEVSVNVVPKEIMDLVSKRREARGEGDFASADKLRVKIEELGYTVEDSTKGEYIRKK